MLRKKDDGPMTWTGGTGGLRKIADAPRPCLHPEHNPPNNIVLEPGTYEYTCPGCGKSVTFVVGGVYCSSANVGGSCLPEGFITTTGIIGGKW